MTSAPIMEVSQTGAASARGMSKSGKCAGGIQFSDTMDYVSSGEAAEDMVRPEMGKKEACEAAKVHAEKNAAKSSGRQGIRKAKKAEESLEEETGKEFAEVSEKAVEEIAKELGVSAKEVEEAMEMLGLTVFDLLSQGNMASLLAELKGMQTVEILTDAELFSQVAQLTAGVQEDMAQLAKEFGMSVDELEQMIFSQLQAATEMADRENTSLSETSDGNEASVNYSVAESVADEVEQIVDKTVDSLEQDFGKTVADSVTEEGEASGEKQLDSTAHRPADAQSHEGFEETDRDDGRQGDEQQEKLQGDVFMDTGIPLGDSSLKAAARLFTEKLDLQQTRDMIEQIADYVKVHHSEKLSSMEIQLNPANLGTVSLRVVAQDGVISARLTAQDEAVRAALEGQVAQLKESLEAQGIKVDAVEVTAESHAFEQNLQEQEQNGDRQAAEPKKKARRFLNLDELGPEEILEEEISEADRLQIEMMRMGGNKLNFRV